VAHSELEVAPDACFGAALEADPPLPLLLDGDGLDATDRALPGSAPTEHPDSAETATQKVRIGMMDRTRRLRFWSNGVDLNPSVAETP
jgi:hypothetical protein